MKKETIVKIGRDLAIFIGMFVMALTLYEFVDNDGRFYKTLEEVIDYVTDEEFWMLLGLGLIGRVFGSFMKEVFMILKDSAKELITSIQEKLRGVRA